jgi:hypothetical protein
VNQKQLHNVDRETWGSDLALAHQSLAALEFCGTVDPLAAQYARVLGAFYHHLAARDTNQQLIAAADNNSASVTWTADRGNSGSGYIPTQFERNHLFTIPGGSSASRIDVSMTLTQLLSHPFKDPQASVSGARGRARLPSDSAREWDAMAKKTFELHLGSSSGSVDVQHNVTDGTTALGDESPASSKRTRSAAALDDIEAAE